MREFNTSGPCKPHLHYTVMRDKLIEKGLYMVDRGKFFTIWAPRQTGKTTYFELLLNALDNKKYVGVWLSFEATTTYTDEEFWDDFSYMLISELQLKEIEIKQNFKNMHQFKKWLRIDLKKVLKESKFVLIIDEFEGCPERLINQLMHTFRQLYHKKNTHPLQSLILVGVSNISEVLTDKVSPFNIADSIEMPYFTKEEVFDLIGQYEEEEKQFFEEEVKEKIYYNTAGQPGLTCAICKELSEEVCIDRSKSIDIKSLNEVIWQFLHKRIDKNISNIVAKAKEHKDFMMKVLFSEEEIPFEIDDEKVKYLSINGVIDEIDGRIDIKVPLYKKRLISAFKPLYNGEVKYYTLPEEKFSKFLRKDGINIKEIIENYIKYLQRRGAKAFNYAESKEAVYVYSFDSYINLMVEELEGEVLLEVPTGRGRMDLLIYYGDKKYIMELKRWKNDNVYQRGKRQLVEYVKSEGIGEGYYIVFSDLHRENVKEEEEIEGIKINSYIIKTQFETP